MKDQLKQLTYKVGKQNLYFIEVHDSAIKLLLIRFPHWEAYSSFIDSEIWIRITPNINLRNRSVFIEQKEIRIDDSFFDTIPNELQNTAIKFYDSHWEIIRASIFLGEDFINLIKINPSFAYLITNLEVINPAFRFHTEYELLTKLIRTKQRKILAYAMLPYTNNMRKLFSKFDITTISRDKLTKVCSLILKFKNSGPKLDKLISHIDSINENLITMMSRYPELVQELNQILIDELTKSNDFTVLANQIEELRKRCREVKIKLPKINKISEIPDLLLATNKKIIERKLLGYDFIEPPIEGDDFIKPIRSSKEQRSWARKQKNCIAGLISSVIQEQSYFYSVNYYGEEATLEISFFNNNYKTKELKGFQNSKVSSRLRKHVNQWLKNKKTQIIS